MAALFRVDQGVEQPLVIERLAETGHELLRREVMVLRAALFEHVYGRQRPDTPAELPRPARGETLQKPGTEGIAHAGWVDDSVFGDRRDVDDLVGQIDVGTLLTEGDDQVL